MARPNSNLPDPTLCECLCTSAELRCDRHGASSERATPAVVQEVNPISEHKLSWNKYKFGCRSRRGSEPRTPVLARPATIYYNAVLKQIQISSFSEEVAQL
jgi:hypothetical protein